MNSVLAKISSHDRVGGSNSTSDFRINLNHTVEIKAVSIKTVSFTNIFDNVNDGNNIFSFEVAGVPKSFTIANGFYNIAELIVLLEAGFLTQAITTVITVVGGFLVFTGTAFEMLSLSDGNAMGDLLGVVLDADGIDSASITLTGKPDLSGEDHVYLVSNALSDSANMVSGQLNRYAQNVICDIPITAEYGGLQIYTADVGEHNNIIHSGSHNVADIDIKLVSGDGRVLGLYNHHLTVIAKLYRVGQ